MSSGHRAPSTPLSHTRNEPSHARAVSAAVGSRCGPGVSFHLPCSCSSHGYEASGHLDVDVRTVLDAVSTCQTGTYYYYGICFTSQHTGILFHRPPSVWGHGHAFVSMDYIVCGLYYLPTQLDSGGQAARCLVSSSFRIAPTCFVLLSYTRLYV